MGGNVLEDTADLGVTALLSAYRRKQVSPLEVAKATLDRIDRMNGDVNAFCLVDPDRTLKDAARSETRWMAGSPCGALDGIPSTIKDIVLTEGWPTLRGSLTVDPDGEWTEDAPAVSRLKESGAIIVGKTTTSEFGWKGVTDSPRHGITRNPWATDRTTGGSSGGAAAAAALGLGVLHLGTDAGGSIRIPAAFSGVFGLKPSYGRVPAYPHSPFGSIAHLGPITRTVEDACWMMNEMSRADPRDASALPPQPIDYRLGLRKGVKGLRIAFSPTLGYADVDPEVANLAVRAAAVIRDLGATVDEVESIFDDPLWIISTLWNTGAARVAEALTEAQIARLDPGLQEVIERGREVSLRQYLDALNARESLKRTANLFHQDYDLLVTPTLPIPAFPAGQNTVSADQGSWLDWAPFSYPFNLTQQPACSVPCGLTESGLPVGFQIVGGLYRDELVLQAAAAFEAACPFPTLAQPKVTHTQGEC